MSTELFNESQSELTDLQLEQKSLEDFLNPQKRKEIKIVAEGDSWFSFGAGIFKIQKDILHHLKKRGFALRRQKNNFAKAGDTLENMVYGSEFDINENLRTVTNCGPESFDAVISAVQAFKPKWMLFSAGGNDILGEEMAAFLNHRSAYDNPFKEDDFRNHVNGPMKKAIKRFIVEVSIANEDVEILMDGYDFPIPNGKPIKIAGKKILGPWILNNMGKKGITDKNEQKAILKKIVDIFNEMLIGLDTEIDNFHHIDLRGKFDNENEWHDEMHLLSDGFKEAADAYYEKMEEIIGEETPLENMITEEVGQN